MYKVSLYENTYNTDAYAIVELESILLSIKDGYYESKVDQYRFSEIDKRLLPCFTPSGIFRKRQDNELLQYSNIIHLDFDKVKALEKAVFEINLDKYTYGSFISPSMNGIKVFVKTNNPSHLHQECFKQVKEYYQDLIGCKIDESGKNLSRLCYVSHDLNAYINNYSAVFNLTVKPKQLPAFRETINNSIASYLIGFTNKRITYIDGYRNNYIFLLACNCNRYGVDKIEAQSMCQNVWVTDNSNFSELELLNTVDSAYRNQNEFAKYHLPKELQNEI